VIGKLKDRDHLEDISGKIILKWISKKEDDLDWIDLDQKRGKSLAVVGTVMDLRVSRNLRNILSSWGTVSFFSRTLLRGVSVFVSQPHLAPWRYWWLSLSIPCAVWWPRPAAVCSPLQSPR
jgi:hypothetical protein